MGIFPHFPRFMGFCLEMEKNSNWTNRFKIYLTGLNISSVGLKLAGKFGVPGSIPRPTDLFFWYLDFTNELQNVFF